LPTFSASDGRFAFRSPDPDSEALRAGQSHRFQAQVNGLYSACKIDSVIQSIVTGQISEIRRVNADKETICAATGAGLRIESEFNRGG
jgi:hypothetical protein